MNKRRWIAIIIACFLIFLSIGFRFVSSVVSLVSNNVFSDIEANRSPFHEDVIIDGDALNKIAVIEVNGIIQGGDNNSLFSITPYNHEDVLNMVYHAGESEDVEAILLSIDSPGGAVGETAELHRAIVEMQEMYDKPIYVSMGELAASGGYYIAAPADKIYAQPTTLTGSIGVIMESINFGKLFEKYGIEYNTIKSGKHKDIMSPSREMTDEEKEILQSMIDEMFDDFVDVIVDGRNMSEDRVRELADGRVYTGRQAKAADLVDEVGLFDDALYSLMEDYNLEDAQVVQYSNEYYMFGLFKVDLPNIFKKKQSELDTVIELMQQSDHPRAMYLY